MKRWTFALPRGLAGCLCVALWLAPAAQAQLPPAPAGVTPAGPPPEAPPEAPTGAPTGAPSAAPAAAPTVAPTPAPAAPPVVVPAVAPTASPTVAPTVAPTAAPKVVCPPPISVAAEAAAAPKDRGLLWRATRDGRTVYLFGTLHVGKPHWRKLGPQISAALRASDLLALEVDPSDPALIQAMADARPPQPLPEPLQQRLMRAFQRACMASEALATLHPVLQATTLTVMEARWLGMDSSYAMEQVLTSQVRTQGRRVVALESAAAQIQALVPEDEEEARSLLDQSLQQLEDQSARRVLDKLASAWEQGDVAALENYEAWCECAADEADRAALRKLNDERNGPLADGIEGHHKQGRRVFAAVGALHMTGPQSLPKLLEQRGFKVERVVFKR